MDLERLYQEVLLAHYRHPRRRGTLATPTGRAHVANPSCGDEVIVEVRTEGDRLAEIRFGGYGCSISQASASMMADRLEGRTRAGAEALYHRVLALVHGDPEAARDPALGDLRALAGVAKFPARVRCALLAWEALAHALRASA